MAYRKLIQLTIWSHTGSLMAYGLKLRWVYKLETQRLCRAIGRLCPNTPGWRCVKPSHWNVISRGCTSPLCSICLAAKLMGTQHVVRCASSIYLPLRQCCQLNAFWRRSTLFSCSEIATLTELVTQLLSVFSTGPQKLVICVQLPAVLYRP